MPKVEYVLYGKKFESEKETTILNISLQAGVPHTCVCGGNARCSTCRVIIVEGLEFCAPRNAKEQALAERLHFNPRIRLACQTKITGDVKLRRLALDDEDVELVNQLKSGGKPGSIGEEKKIAIMFADIRKFTTFVEPLPPYDVIHVLNRYFHQMAQIVHRHGGYIDNYMGDGLLALFGVENSAEAPLRAVAAGIEMLEAMDRLNSYVETLYEKRLQIGIGIHYGEVVIGALGSFTKKRETVVGDAVNLASRIEAANKELGTSLLISQDVYEQVKNQVRVGQRIQMRVRGKSGKCTVYEVIGMNA